MGIRDSRLVARLAAMPGWCESIPDEKRAGIIRGLLERFEDSDLSVREQTSIAKTLAMFQRNDIETVRLVMEAEKHQPAGSEAGEAEQFRDIANAIREMRPARPVLTPTQQEGGAIAAS